MKTFIIDSQNNITVFASYKEAKTSDATDAVIFTTEDELAKLVAYWPTHRLVDMWSSLTGVTPVKKFTDRKTAIARIWKAIQSLQFAPEAEEKEGPARAVAPGGAAESKVSSKARKKAAPEGQGARGQQEGYDPGTAASAQRGYSHPARLRWEIASARSSRTGISCPQFFFKSSLVRNVPEWPTVVYNDRYFGSALKPDRQIEKRLVIPAVLRIICFCQCGNARR